MSPHLDGPDEPLAPLPIGALAPTFALPQTLPQTLPHWTHSSLLEMHHRGRRRAAVLVFYPMDWEPVSRKQHMLYQAYADAFDRLGARLLGISCDHLYCHAPFARNTQLHFPQLADCQPRGAVARQYGVYREEQGVSARALFVLDTQPRHVIRFSTAYPDALNPGVDELLTTLETLAAAPAGDESTGTC